MEFLILIIVLVMVGASAAMYALSRMDRRPPVERAWFQLAEQPWAKKWVSAAMWGIMFNWLFERIVTDKTSSLHIDWEPHPVVPQALSLISSISLFALVGGYGAWHLRGMFAARRIYPHLTWHHAAIGIPAASLFILLVTTSLR